VILDIRDIGGPNTSNSIVWRVSVLELGIRTQYLSHLLRKKKEEANVEGLGSTSLGIGLVARLAQHRSPRTASLCPLPFSSGTRGKPSAAVAQVSTDRPSRPPALPLQLSAAALASRSTANPATLHPL
jgi:hypothetical protein